MKNKYIVGLVLILLASTSFGQRTNDYYSFENSNSLNVKKQVSSAAINKSIVWQETFDIGATAPASTAGPSFITSNGTWTTAGSAGNVWKHAFYAASGQYSTGAEFLPTSVADGFMVFDADSNDFANGNAFATVSGELISPTIDLTGETSVSVVLEHEFRFCCTGSHNLNLQVSIDNGLIWGAPINLATFVGANDEYSDVMGSYQIERNITAQAANQSQVKLKFTWDGVSSGSSHYYWDLDDICITQGAQNDLVAYEPYWGTDAWAYYQIPTTQVAPIDFSTIAFNKGENTQNNVRLDVDINSGAWTGSGNALTLNTNEHDTSVLTTQYTPAATVGTHNVTWMLNQDETEETPADNTNAAFSFEVTDFIYARDDGNPTSNLWGSGQAYELGNLFDIFQDQTLYSVDVDLNAFTAPGSEIQAIVYEVDFSQPTIADMISQLGTSDYHIVVGSDLNGILNLPLINPVPLTNAQLTYFVSLSTTGNGGVGNDMVLETTPTGSCWWLSPTTGEWTTVERIPIIRMNFENNVGLNELNSFANVNVYPNPSINKVTVDYTIAASSDIRISVVDITGKTIKTFAEGSKEAGSHALLLNTESYESGIYYINIEHNNGVTTSKFVKN